MEDKQAYDQLKHELQTTVVTNVFGKDEFKEQFLIVFEHMAKYLSSTLGPFGSATMIDKGTDFSVTKDGFHVLANLRFADMKQNRIYTTLFNISHQMVTRVGDGSTSAVIAAYAFLKEMMKSGILDDPTIRPKNLNMTIQGLVNKICTIISNNAKQVTSDNINQVVERVARIATNDNDTYTNMITEIYKKLGANCDINISKSQTFETSVIYEDGVYSNDNYLVDKLYHNRGNTCHLNDCKVLIFDNALEPEIFDLFAIAFNSFCQINNSTLIVIAPYYDQYLMDKIRKDAEKYVNLYSNAAVIRFPMVFIKSNLTKPVQKEMYRDLAAMLGATIIQPPDVKEVTQLLNDVAKEAAKARAENKIPSEETMNKIRDFIKDHLGGCDEAILGDKTSAFKGFSNINEALFNKAIHDAKVSLEEAEAKASKMALIDDDVYDAKTRLSKINCKSATIVVGGANALEIEMNADAVDDAVKACASAVKYGYNMGCNLAIIKAIDACDAIVDTYLDQRILLCLSKAFYDVYKTILCNGMPEDEAMAIIHDCVKNNYMPYDMANGNIDKDGAVINSCQTDIEILRGAIAMVGVVLTCNQYISTTLNR